jgi:hypothetical protein
MAWDEWERIKAGVAERQPTGTQLNQVPVEPGPAGSAVTGGLMSSRRAWLAAGDGVGSLRRSVSTALGRLENGQSGLGESAGCLSAAAQAELYVSWKKYAEDVSGRCGSLRAIMERVGHEQLLTDEAVKAEIRRVKAAYADLDPVACPGTGR